MDKKEKEIILGAILIFVITIFMLSFGITGHSVKSGVTTIELDPTMVSSNDELQITIQPGKDGIPNTLSFYRLGDNGYTYVGQSDSLCDSVKCMNPTTYYYIIPENYEPGDYYVQVFDYYSEDYIRTKFLVS
ncbi:MAG: hypothetical protein NT139_01015 [Candidatus Woesearchaeota archaeon]|nr:hypothetical protein [Candidatus Woesearchaeota archaeon]